MTTRKAGGQRHKTKDWQPSPEAQELILSTWTPIVSSVEGPLEVLERNMVLYSVLGTRTLEAAGKLRDILVAEKRTDDPAAFAEATRGRKPARQRATARDVSYLMDLGMTYRDRAEKSALGVLPYRQPKLMAIAPPGDVEMDLGSDTNAHGADPVILEDITRTLEKVRAKGGS